MNNSEKKVLIITNIPSPYRVDFFKYLQNNYHEFNFYIIFTNSNEDNREWNSNLDGLENYYILKSFIYKHKNKLYQNYSHIPFGLYNKINKINPHIIIAFEYNVSAVLSLLWAKTHNKKFIHLTDGTLNSESFINSIQKLLRKIIVKYSDAYIASSTKAKEKLMFYGAPSKKIYISLLTEDLSIFKKKRKAVANTGNFVFLFVGQIIERKGLDLLFNALSKLKFNYVLNIVGSGQNDYVNKLKKIAVDLNIVEKINFLGYKNGFNLVNEYNNCDLFVFPSKNDCFGLVMLEAYAIGKYQIVSKYADGAFDIINNKNGIIIDPYNIEEFVKSLNNVFNSIDNYKHIDTEDIIKFDFKNTSIGFINALYSTFN